MLRSFRDQPRQTLMAVSTATALPHPTVLRLLKTLEEEGYVRRDQGLWELAPQILEIGFAALHSMGVDEFVRRSLQGVADTLTGIVNLSEKNGNEVIIIARATGKAETRSLFTLNRRVGHTLPDTSASYKALNLGEDEWSSTSYPEHQLLSVGVPVTHGERRALALSISVNLLTYTPDRVEEEVIPLLRETRGEIRRLMHL